MTRLVPRSLARTLTAAAPLLVAAACSDPVDPVRYAYGFIIVEAKGTSGDYHTRPLAYFFREQALVLPTSSGTQDQCDLFDYAPSTGSGAVSGTLDFLDAGAQMTVVDADGAQTAMPQQVQTSGAVVYTTTDTAGIAYTPGDSLQFVVPGGGAGEFPAATIKARSAEAFTLAPVPIQNTGDFTVPLSWTPAGDTTSKMNFSLRYSSPGAQALDKQIACSVVDDGSFAIPAIYTSGWRTSYNARREVAAQRLRTRLQQAGDTTLLVFSTYTVTGTVATR